MLPTMKNQCFLQVRNMISVSNGEKSSFFWSRKHDQCFEWQKNIVFLQQETWSVFRMTKNMVLLQQETWSVFRITRKCFSAAIAVISVSNHEKTLFCCSKIMSSVWNHATKLFHVSFSSAFPTRNVKFHRSPPGFEGRIPSFPLGDSRVEGLDLSTSSMPSVQKPSPSARVWELRPRNLSRCPDCIVKAQGATPPPK